MHITILASKITIGVICGGACCAQSSVEFATNIVATVASDWILDGQLMILYGS